MTYNVFGGTLNPTLLYYCELTDQSVNFVTKPCIVYMALPLYPGSPLS